MAKMNCAGHEPSNEERNKRCPLPADLLRPGEWAIERDECSDRERAANEEHSTDEDHQE